METDPLLASSSASVASDSINASSNTQKTPLPLKNRLVGLIGGIIGAIILIQLILLPGPKEKIHLDFQIRDLQWDDLNFLHTTDTHGWYSGHLNQQTYHANWGDFISFASRLRDIANANGQDLLLVDTGDRHDGNGFSDITSPNGKVSLPIFLQQDYDLITIGNHELYEFENSKLEYDWVVSRYGERYVSSNVEYRLENGTFVPFGQKYRYFTTKNKGLRVLSFAFLFDFDRFNNGTSVIPIKVAVKQSWFKKALAKHPEDEVDVLVVFGHIPVARSWQELQYLHHVLRKHYPNTKIQYFGGHSHIRDYTVFDANATGLQSGRFCETVGWASLSVSKAISNTKGDIFEQAKEHFHRSYIDFSLDSFYHHSKANSPQDFDTPIGLNVTEKIFHLRKKLGLQKTLGTVSKLNYYVSYVPVDHERSIFQFLANKVLFTLRPAEGKQHNKNKIVIINTGSIRYDLYKGPYTIDSQYIVSPFENDWVKITVPKKVATKIAATLNDAAYIISGQSENLKPPHLWNVDSIDGSYSEVNADILNSDVGSERVRFAKTTPPRMSKGYLTIDDFGRQGDDTPHRPVVNFPVPNVVESVQLEHDLSDDDLVDVVFYSFISKNIIWALAKLEYLEEVDVSFYSDEYLGLLLTSYIQKHGA